MCNVVAQTRKEVSPENGDYIDALIKRNGLDAEEYRAAFIKINKKKLGANNTLRLDTRYELPTPEDIGLKNGGQTTERRQQVVPILGEKYKTVDYVDNALKGATFYLVSGHGGPDPGAQAIYAGSTLSEDEYAYDVMLRLARQLIRHRALVHVIIRDPSDGIRDDEILANSDNETCLGAPIPLNQIDRLRQRTDSINTLYAKERKNSNYCRSVFLHLDSRSKDKRIDIFFYHFTKSVKGERLASVLRNKMEEKYRKHQPKRGFSGNVSERNLFVLRETDPVGVFLELGNIQNPLDLLRFVRPSNREAMARWIAEGLIEDYKAEKNSTKK